MHLGTACLLISGATLLGVACTKVIQTDAATTQGQTLVGSASDIAPETVPYDKASLILFGKSYPVTVKPTTTDKTLDLEFDLNSGEHFLDENYVYDNVKFALASTSGESYDPPLPVLTYPLRENEVRQWKGTVNYGKSSEPATADLTAKKETLNLAGGHYDTIEVEAKVTYTGGTNTKTVRSLKFWFAPHKGLVKRDFGLNSTREPLPAEQPSNGS